MYFMSNCLSADIVSFCGCGCYSSSSSSLHLRRGGLNCVYAADTVCGLPGAHISSIQVQHVVGAEDRRGARQPVRAAQDVGRTAEDQQELSTRHHQGADAVVVGFHS